MKTIVFDLDGTLIDSAPDIHAAAARMLFGPPEAVDWHFVQLTGSAPDEAMQALERAGHARLGPRLAVGARPMPSLKQPAVLFRAEVVSGLTAGQSIAARNAFLLKAELGKGEGEAH